jgi:hypothetical protein
MKVERSIGVTLRSMRQVTDELAKFVEAVLAARSFPAAGQAGARVKRLEPLLSALFTQRIGGTPALCVRTDDMEVRVRVDHEVTAVDDLSVPAMDLLGDLDGPVDIIVYATEEVAPDLSALASTTDGPVRLRLVVGPAEAEAPAAEDDAAEDDAEPALIIPID